MQWVKVQDVLLCVDRISFECSQIQIGPKGKYQIRFVKEYQDTYKVAEEEEGEDFIQKNYSTIIGQMVMETMTLIKARIDFGLKHGVIDLNALYKEVKRSLQSKNYPDQITVGNEVKPGTGGSIP